MVRTDFLAPAERLHLVCELNHGRGRTLALESAHEQLLVATDQDCILRLGIDWATGKLVPACGGAGSGGGGCRDSGVGAEVDADALTPLRVEDGHVGIRRLRYSDQLGLVFLHNHLSVLPPLHVARASKA